MLAKDTKEGQLYILPGRIGNNVIGIQSGINYSGEYVLFLLKDGKERIMKTVLPTEEVIQVR